LQLRAGDRLLLELGGTDRALGQHAGGVADAATCQVIGIGLLVEVLRRLGLAFVEVRRDDAGSR